MKFNQIYVKNILIVIILNKYHLIHREISLYTYLDYLYIFGNDIFYKIFQV